MAVCVTVIGKENDLKFFSCLDPNLKLKFQYKMHTALDFIEEKLSSVGKSSASDMRDLYLGLLYSTKEYKIYGYVTNTKIKFIIAIDAGNLLLRDNETRMMFRKLHAAYADTVCNPFYTPQDDVISKNFVNAVNSIMEEVV